MSLLRPKSYEEKLTVTLHRSLQIGVYKDEIKAKNKNDILEEN